MFKKILLGVIVLLILYLVYIYVFQDATSSNLYSGGNAKRKVVIPASTLPGNKASVDFSFSIWIYVDSWQYRYGTVKTIFSRNADSNGSVAPSLALAASTNDLQIRLDSFNTDGGSGGANNTWNIHDIPIQKWCNIIIATNNRAVDTYIDGKLVNTHVLNNIPKMNKSAPVVVSPDGGFAGEISKFRYIARTVSPREAYEIYRDGPGTNWLSDFLSQYKLKLAFLKNNEELNSFEI